MHLFCIGFSCVCSCKTFSFWESSVVFCSVPSIFDVCSRLSVKTIMLQSHQISLMINFVDGRSEMQSGLTLTCGSGGTH